MTRRVRRARREGLHQGVEAIGQQHRIGTGFRQIGGRAHGHADVGGGEHRHIIDAVAEHQHLATFLVQLLQHLQLVVRAQAAAGLVDAQFGGDAGDHRRAVAGQQQRAPAARLARGEQGRRVVAQAVVEDEPGQRPLSVAEQQPLARLRPASAAARRR